MDLIDLLSAAQGGKSFSNIGRQFGLDERQTESAVEALAPVLAAGIRRNLSSDHGYGDLVGALQKGNHQAYFDDENAIQYDNVVEDGNRMLGHVLGSKQASREVVNYAAGQTGIGSTILKKMLPIVISMTLGSLTKGMAGGRGKSQGGGGLGDILGDILGGGAGGQTRQPRQQQGNGGLGDILGDILGGGAGGGAGGGGQTRQLRPQQAPPGGFGDILREILGGGSGGGGRSTTNYDPNEQPDMNIDESIFRQDPQCGKEAIDDYLGRGSSQGTAADDLLNSVEAATRGRR
jgi:hypothetical protein